MTASTPTSGPAGGAGQATPPLTVLISPDSFKGTASARQAAGAIAEGWQSVRPRDQVIVKPMADGGEGTADAIADASAGARWIRSPATGPDGRQVAADWLLLDDGTAVVELARASGLPLMADLDPLGAQTVGFGEQLKAAAEHPDCRRIVATLGGSAATDGGTGALSALGAVVIDAQRRPLRPGGGALVDLAAIDVSALTPAPGGGVRVLTDVTAPLTGPRGAAVVFGPQKGADPDQVRRLDAALATLATVLRKNGFAADPDAPGSGAAGGAGYGLAAVWGATLEPGAAAVATLIGLPDELGRADVLVSGEGAFDSQSSTGKVVGYLLEQPGPRRRMVIAGTLQTAPPDGTVGIALDALAGNARAAMAEPLSWLVHAGSVAAQSV